MNGTKKRSLILDSLKFGFNAWWAHLGFFVGIMFLSLLFFFAALALFGAVFLVINPGGMPLAHLAVIGRYGTKTWLVEQPGLTLVVVGCALTLFVLKQYVMLGLTKVSLYLYDQKSVSIKTFLSAYPYIVNNIVASIAYFVMFLVAILPVALSVPMFFVFPFMIRSLFFTLILAGVLLFIGLCCMYLIIGFSLYQQYIVDQHAGPLQALRASGEITKGYRWQLLGIALIFWCIDGLSVNLLFGIPLLFTIPFNALALVYFYRKVLIGHAQKAVW